MTNYKRIEIIGLGGIKNEFKDEAHLNIFIIICDNPFGFIGDGIYVHKRTGLGGDSRRNEGKR